jgi:hypothetical protein
MARREPPGGLWRKGGDQGQQPKSKPAKGVAKAKSRSEAGNAEQEKFMAKGEQAGRPGAPKLTRAEIRRAKRI